MIYPATLDQIRSKHVSLFLFVIPVFPLPPSCCLWCRFGLFGPLSSRLPLRLCSIRTVCQFRCFVSREMRCDASRETSLVSSRQFRSESFRVCLFGLGRSGCFCLRVSEDELHLLVIQVMSFHFCLRSHILPALRSLFSIPD